jgi:hypothetical protein
VNNAEVFMESYITGGIGVLQAVLYPYASNQTSKLKTTWADDDFGIVAVETISRSQGDTSSI